MSACFALLCLPANATHPEKLTFVGSVRDAVYLVRLDDDDLQYLERHPLPR